MNESSSVEPQVPPIESPASPTVSGSLADVAMGGIMPEAPTAGASADVDAAVTSTLGEEPLADTPASTSFEFADEGATDAYTPPLLTAESQIGEIENSAVPTQASEVPAVVATASIEAPTSLVPPDEAAATASPERAPVAASESASVSATAPASAAAPVGAAPLISEVPVGTTGVWATSSDAAPLPPLVEADPPVTSPPTVPVEALKALFPGAFLRGEYEVREILARGTTNLYRAVGGDYGAPEPKLIAERAAKGGGETAGTGSAAEVTGDGANTLRPPCEAFAQDEREYLVFEWFDSTSLQDWRGATNDEQLLAMLAPVTRFLKETHARGETAEISTDTLRVDSAGTLRFVGFTAPGAGTPLEDLRHVADFAFKHVFAQSATMRLDDRFAGLALSDELKDFARRLDQETGFDSIEAAADALDVLAATNLTTDFALLSDVGQERELNEDAGMIVASRRAGHLQSYARELFVVSDGMGGHEGGEVASDLTLSSLQKHMDALQLDWQDNAAIRAGLVDVIDAVNADVVALTETDQYRGTRAKPGATLVFALRLGARLFIGNVGDSRAYLFRDGQLLRVSKDHSYVQNLIDRGELDEESAWDHPEGSVITAHIGYPKLKTRDVFVRLARPGDRWLLVSDGVVDMLRDRDIAPHLQGSSADAVVQSLVDAANAAGGADNITALCVEFEGKQG